MIRAVTLCGRCILYMTGAGKRMERGTASGHHPVQGEQRSQQDLSGVSMHRSGKIDRSSKSANLSDAEKLFS